MSVKRFKERKQVVSNWVRVYCPHKSHVRMNNIIKLIVLFAKNIPIELLSSIPLITGPVIKYEISPLLGISLKKMANELYILTVIDKKWNRCRLCLYKL